MDLNMFFHFVYCVVSEIHFKFRFRRTQKANYSNHPCEAAKEHQILMKPYNHSTYIHEAELNLIQYRMSPKIRLLAWQNDSWKAINGN